MQKFNDFYQSLDFLNLVLFWGIVVVIILIILFLILSIINSKNNKYVVGELDLDSEDDNKDVEVIINKNESDNNVSLRENNYVQEEIVIDDSNNKEEEKEEVKNISLFDDLIPTSEEKKNNLYQKNVFREMSSRYQTSPIGIVKEEKEDIKEYENDINTGDKDNYLENVYNNLEKAVVPDKIELTDYEKKQEEEAVISYQELIRKKDNINVEDNEEAIISYNELINTKNKLYNITKEEENQEFLSELKKFRNDL